MVNLFFISVFFENNTTRVEDLIDNKGNLLSSNQFSEQHQLKPLSPSILD